MDLKDKVPPHNLEAEKATLGAILLDWGSIGDVITYLRSDNFYSQQNQIIFEAMTGLFSKGIRGDMLTLIDDLTKSGNLEKAGGTAYVSTLTDTVPTSSNVDYYAKIVLDNSTRRNLIKISSDIKSERLLRSRISAIRLRSPIFLSRPISLKSDGAVGASRL